MKGNIIKDETIQGLLDRYLKAKRQNTAYSGHDNHLDEDTITAFVEGKTGERESHGIVKHLVDCSFCLHITAEMARLNYAFADEELPVSNVTQSEPASISSVLSGLLSRIFGTSDGAVFAHHEEEEKKDDDDKKES